MVAHEIGHALGLAHVCPLNETKLMEPVLALAFDGPQFDDILGAQRWYGDSHAYNDTPGTATPLGAFAAGGHFFDDLLSVADDSDVNVYSFSVTSLANTATVTISPTTVAPYLLGPETTSCENGDPFDPATIRTLGVEMLDTDGTTILTNATASSVGLAVTLSNIPLTSGGPYFVRVFGDATDDIQSYELNLQVGTAGYAFEGFSAPVDNPPVLNVAKAGKPVPLKWRLLDGAGAPVTTLTSATLTAVSRDCALGTTPDQIEEYAAGASGLQNLGAGYYQYNWQTPKSYAKSCKTLQLALGDGLVHEALFQFTK